MTERRILLDALGARVGPGPRMPAADGMERASNESRQVFDLWLRARHRGRWPRLEAMFPGQLGALLDRILVVDVLQDPVDYRYRFVGAMEVAARKADITGMTVREVNADLPEVLDFCMENYRQAIASPTGLIDFSVASSADPHLLEVETLLLPLSSDGQRVTQVLVYSHYVAV